MIPSVRYVEWVVYADEAVDITGLLASWRGQETTLQWTVSRDQSCLHRANTSCPPDYVVPRGGRNGEIWGARDTKLKRKFVFHPSCIEGLAKLMKKHL
jgi:hypothetical protein